jgi:hypothetical protein
MSNKRFDRKKLVVKRLCERENKVLIERDLISPETILPVLPDHFNSLIEKTAKKIMEARQKGKPVILAFGAHTIKNGMGPVLISLIKEGWLTHLATNGAGIIHDWEFAYQGKSSEDVRKNVDKGQFGIWEETGSFINLALAAGAYEELGYGESIGKMICSEGLFIPEVSELYHHAESMMKRYPAHASAAIDFAGTILESGIGPGFLSIPHPYKKYSVQAAAWEKKVPFTGHPMIGHDIIYTHPLNNGAAVGRTALADFLCFAESVSNIDNGVYMSVGSAVMSPMIFEKAFSMAQNIAIQRQNHINSHFILVVDLAEMNWDWSKEGEPPSDNPAYYLRYCKTFSRMGGEMNYLKADNRYFLLALHRKLNEI